MGSLHFQEVEDFSEEENGPLAKRSRSSDSSFDQVSANSGFPVHPSQYNPLDEPSPLGLRLKKSPSLLDLIQMRLSQGYNVSPAVSQAANATSSRRSDVKGNVSSCMNDKLKASNFPALLLRIGSWEYLSKYEGDLVAKCYFAKHKLVWEVLEGGLKSKIEIQWSDIMALKADCPDNGPSTLAITLARQPIFFRETNPQPRKHTLWQSSSDFTNGQAEKYRQHYLQFSPGVLNKHYEKLIQCDTRLNNLSHQPERVMDSLYFDYEASGFENSEGCKSEEGVKTPSTVEESSSSMFGDVESGASASSCILNLGQNPLACQHLTRSAPCSSDKEPIQGKIKVEKLDTHVHSVSEPLNFPGLSSSLSMTDLVNHIGNCITEQVTSKTLSLDKASERQEMLEYVAQVLLTDTQNAAGLDEKSLMKKVNSLCSLLEDPIIGSTTQTGAEERIESKQGHSNDSLDSKLCSISRKDSIGEFLHHLPRIASLPKFLFGIAADEEFQSTRFDSV